MDISNNFDCGFQKIKEKINQNKSEFDIIFIEDLDKRKKLLEKNKILQMEFNEVSQYQNIFGLKKRTLFLIMIEIEDIKKF